MGRGGGWIVISVADDQPNERGIERHHEGDEQSTIQTGICCADVFLALVADERGQLTDFGQLCKGDDPCNDDEKRNEFHEIRPLSVSVLEFDAFLEHGVVLADERRLCQGGKRAIHEEP